MGEHADDAVDAALGHYWPYGDDDMIDDEEGYLPVAQRSLTRRPRAHFQRGTGNFHWRVADGTIVSMHDMSDEHIVNALRFCVEVGQSGKAEQLRQVQDERRQKGLQVPEGTVTTNLFGLPIKAG